jgi:hypothetical protein
MTHSVTQETATLTVDEYYVAVKRLNLHPSNVPHVFTCADDGHQYSVQDPLEFTPEQRFEFIQKLTRRVRG